MEALIVVDMQNCFAKEGGMFYLKQAKAQVPYIKTVVGEFKTNKKPVIYLRVVWEVASDNPAWGVGQSSGRREIVGFGRGAQARRLGC